MEVLQEIFIYIILTIIAAKFYELLFGHGEHIYILFYLIPISIIGIIFNFILGNNIITKICIATIGIIFGLFFIVKFLGYIGCYNGYYKWTYKIKLWYLLN